MVSEKNGIPRFFQYTSRGSGAQFVNHRVGFLLCVVCAQTAAPHLELNDTKAAGVMDLGSFRIFWRSIVNWEMKFSILSIKDAITSRLRKQVNSSKITLEQGKQISDTILYQIRVACAKKNVKSCTYFFIEIFNLFFIEVNRIHLSTAESKEASLHEKIEVSYEDTHTHILRYTWQHVNRSQKQKKQMTSRCTN